MMPRVLKQSIDTDDSLEKEATSKKSRRGRKAIQAVIIGPADENTMKKERSRLAQRVYRNKKESEVRSLKLQVAKLQNALQETIKSFTKFQEKALNSDVLAPIMALELSRTAMEIAGHSQNTSKFPRVELPDQATSSTQPVEMNTPPQDEPRTISKGAIAVAENQFSSVSCDVAVNVREVSKATELKPPVLPATPTTHQPCTPIFPWTASQRNLSFTQTFRLACVERAVQLLSDPSITFANIHPIFSLHLRTMTIEDMRYLSERNLYQKDSPEVHIPKSRAALEPPRIFRTIEGNGKALVPRAEKGEAERLVIGCTRTVVETWLPGFEGEWLEPTDVKEYLECKNIVGIDDDLVRIGRSRVLDKQYLIEYLALRAVCIGVGPAIRKTDVDEALAACMVL